MYLVIVSIRILIFFQKHDELPLNNLDFLYVFGYLINYE